MPTYDLDDLAAAAKSMGSTRRSRRKAFLAEVNGALTVSYSRASLRGGKLLATLDKDGFIFEDLEDDQQKAMNDAVYGA